MMTRGIRPWAIVGCALALVALLLGITGALGRSAPVPDGSAVVGAVAHPIPGFDCPNGRRITTLTAGEPLVALARTGDGAFLAVRSPADAFETVWVTVDSVDLLSRSTSELPVRDCITASVL